MGKTRSLKELLDAADSFIEGSAPTTHFSKEASDEVSGVVNTILNSDTLITQTQPSLSEFEKAAEAYNRQQAVAEIEEICKLAQFCALAEDSGHQPDQIKEALSKIAAAKMVTTVPALSALGFMNFGEDKNELPVEERTGKGRRAEKDRKDLTESQGY